MAWPARGGGHQPAQGKGRRLVMGGVFRGDGGIGGGFFWGGGDEEGGGREGGGYGGDGWRR